MEKRKNTEAIIIIVLLLILIGVVIFLLVNTLKSSDITTADNNKVSDNNNIQETSKEENNVTLENQLKEKDSKIAALEKENEELKKKANETKKETIKKNEYVVFNGSKVKHNGKYISSKALYYPIQVLYFNEEQEADYYRYEINAQGGLSVVYENKTYTVKGLSKRVAEIYAMDDGQTALQGCIAIMEDGTIEQIYFDGNNFKTRGTIGGVKDVVKLIYIVVDGQRCAAAVQADGDTVVLSGLKNYYNPGM